MALASGYNVSKANEIMKNISDHYSSLGGFIQEGWNNVTTTLQGNWIGEDEQAFEHDFATKIRDLYVKSATLATNSINTIAGLTQQWLNFQKSNVLEGSSADFLTGQANIEIPQVKIEEHIISRKERTFSDGEDRGLVSESSAATIKTSIDTYVSDIKTKLEGLFSSIDSNSAFFGEQSKSINEYIVQIGSAIGEVATAVRDLYDQIDKLANTQYSTAQSDIHQIFSQEKTNIDNAVNELGQSRWN